MIYSLLILDIQSQEAPALGNAGGTWIVRGPVQK